MLRVCTILSVIASFDSLAALWGWWGFYYLW